MSESSVKENIFSFSQFLSCLFFSCNFYILYIFSCLFKFTVVCLYLQLFVYETFGADNLGTSIGKYDFVLV